MAYIKTGSVIVCGVYCQPADRSEGNQTQDIMLAVSLLVTSSTSPGGGITLSSRVAWNGPFPSPGCGFERIKYNYTTNEISTTSGGNGLIIQTPLPLEGGGEGRDVSSESIGALDNDNANLCGGMGRRPLDLTANLRAKPDLLGTAQHTDKHRAAHRQVRTPLSSPSWHRAAHRQVKTPLFSPPRHRAAHRQVRTPLSSPSWHRAAHRQVKTPLFSPPRHRAAHRQVRTPLSSPSWHRAAHRQVKTPLFSPPRHRAAHRQVRTPLSSPSWHRAAHRQVKTPLFSPPRHRAAHRQVRTPLSSPSWHRAAHRQVKTPLFSPPRHRAAHRQVRTSPSPFLNTSSRVYRQLAEPWDIVISWARA
uniref:Uncharacterized protein n=1 Tax=Timema cristinae TaxID=61476 RepID=A0A7R9CTI1_TIMCR|nr:unnamed protein product [Timema cristinae]